jgi:hypothetical protein
VNGTNLTFGFTPPVGTFIRITSLALAQAGVPSDGSVTSVKLGSNLTLTGNTSLSGSSGLLINQNAFDTTYFSGSTTPTVQLSTLIGASGFPSSSSMSVTRWGNAAGASGFVSAKSRGTAIGVRGAVSSGDNLGQMSFQGDDGTNFVQCALVLGACDGTVSSGVVPGRLLFSTMSTAGTFAERMRITSGGLVGIGTSSPTNTLQVAGGISATSSAPAFQASAAIIDVSGGIARFNATGADNVTNGIMTFNTGSANAGVFNERMRIAAGGDVGIGTASPSYKLDVRSGSSALTLGLSSTDTTAYQTTAYNGNKARISLITTNATGATNGINLSTGGSHEVYIGSVQESGGAGAFVVQGYSGSVYAERMRIDSSGNVGIGTTSPTRRLQVSQSNATTYASDFDNTPNQLYLVNTNTTTNAYTGLQMDVGSNSQAAISAVRVGDGEVAMTFSSRVAGVRAERMRIGSTGNVGIGTSSPASALQVLRASSNPTVNLTRTTSSATNIGEALYVRLNDTNGTNGMRTEIGMGYGIPATQTFTPAVLGYVQTFGSNNTYGDLYFATRPVSDDVAPTERMRITSAGLVTIGISTPTTDTQLTINNSARATSLECNYDRNNGTQSLRGGILQFLPSPPSSAGGDGSIIQSNYWGGAAEGKIKINAYAQTNQLVLSTTGSIFIGCNANPSGSSGGTAFVPAGAYGVTRLLFSSNNTATVAMLAFDNPNGNVGSIGTSGSNAYYSTTSDYRLKENIAPITGALDKVTQLKPVTYTWKADGSDGQGFIAHELQEVVPDAVTGEKDAVDAEGNPKYQGIDTSFLVATLTAAIQEQQVQIEELRAEIQALKGQ